MLAPMGRPKRLDVQDGWHHVVNRGAGGRGIFLTRTDGEEFERLLARGVEESTIEVHAYCLMPNHFHLLLHCPDGGLSRFMQRLASRCSRYANARLGRDGALFRGRFRSIAIATPQQLVNASVYIHRNAEDLAAGPSLREYRWSSLRWYAGESADAPAWLTQGFVLDCFSGDRARYLAYVEQGRAA